MIINEQVTLVCLPKNGFGLSNKSREKGGKRQGKQKLGPVYDFC